MKNKLLIVLIVLSSVNTVALAYNDYGYSYGLSNGSSGGYNASMGIRESQNDFNGYMQRQAVGMASLFQINQGNQCYSSNRQVQSQQSYVNPNRSYVVDKPLPLNGIYGYDAYEGLK